MRGNPRQELRAAARDSALECVGLADAMDPAHQRVAGAILRAFPKARDKGLLLIEASVAGMRDLPPDVLVIHPDVGVCVIEVKGWTTETIERARGGTFEIRENGRLEPKNPFHQVRTCMFAIKNAVERRTGKADAPLLTYLVAFPNICRREWAQEGLGGGDSVDKTLLADDFEDGDATRQAIATTVEAERVRRKIQVALKPEQVDSVRAAFGDSAVLRDLRERRTGLPETALGLQLDELALRDASLSRQQMDLSRLAVGGHPRLVRGVAGSGKTIVLANMVARYINRRLYEELFPGAPPRVGVVCFNRALVPFIEKKVHESYWDQSRSAVPPNVLEVTHLNGLLYSLSRQGALSYVPVAETDAAGRALAYMGQLSQLRAAQPASFAALQYEVLFVDEGQDFVPEEYRLLLELVHPSPPRDERPLVIFYDDAQNVYGRPRPNWQELGIDVQRGDRSRVMTECFRNTRQIIEFAFNILLGSHAPNPRAIGTRGFADTAYLGDKRLVEERGDGFVVNFAERIGPAPEVRRFQDANEETEWLVTRIHELIARHMVRSEDILVLAEQKDVLERVATALTRQLPRGTIAGLVRPYREEEKDQYIFRGKHLTLSTVKSAKGYDAYVVFLVGAHVFRGDVEGRAAFYVGATRAKHLLTVTGTSGPLLEEALAHVNGGRRGTAVN